MATIEELMMRLNAMGDSGLPNLPQPATPMSLGPLQPVGGNASPVLTLPPEPAPVAPMPGLDQNLIRQYLALLPPAPAAPNIREPSTLDRIAGVLGGVALGPQYGRALREERERPIREYNEQLERFNARKSELGLRGLEATERKAERQQAQTQRTAEIKADREFELYKQRSGITDKLALQQLDEAHGLAKLREQERAADERLLKQQRLQFAKEVGAQIKFYKSNGVGNATQARRLALNDLGDAAAELGVEVPPLTAGDNKVLVRVQAVVDRLDRLGRGSFGGGGGTGQASAPRKAVEAFESARQVVVDAVRTGNFEAETQARRAMQSAFNRLDRFPGQVQRGLDSSGNWPWAKVWDGQRFISIGPGAQGQTAQPQAGQAQQGQQMQFNLTGPSDADVQSYAQTYGVTPEVARKELMEMRQQ